MSKIGHMVRKVKCNPGNKACGGRCVPEAYNCAGEGTSDQELMGTSGKEIQKAETRGGKQKAQTTKQFANQQLDRMEAEAHQLAGGEEAYQKELNKMFKDSGAGISAVLVRNTMRTLAPQLMRSDDVAFYLAVKKKGKYEKQVIRPNKPFKMEDMVRRGDKLKKGDVIRVRFPSDKIAGGAFYHYAVYTGNGRIVHYNPIKRDKGKKVEQTGHVGVAEIHLKDLQNTGRYKWEKTGVKSKYSPAQLQRRIAKVKDKKIKFNLMINNCEHFAHLLTQGKAYSSQTDAAEGMAKQTIKLIFDYFQNQVLRKKGGLVDSRYDREFLTQNQLEFAEKNYVGGRKKGNAFGEDFKYPRNEKDVEADLNRALQFATVIGEQDVKSTIGILTAWLQTYITNLSTQPSK